MSYTGEQRQDDEQLRVNLLKLALDTFEKDGPVQPEKVVEVAQRFLAFARPSREPEVRVGFVSAAAAIRSAQPGIGHNGGPALDD